MCAVTRAAVSPSIGPEEISAMNALSDLLYEVVPVHAPASREQLSGLLSDAGQAAVAKGITPEERERVSAAADKALAAWTRVKTAIENKMQMDLDNFVRGIGVLRSSGTLPDGFQSLSAKCYGVIRNIEWVNAFAWQLPVMDPHRAKLFREIATVMASLLYLELYGKQQRAGSSDMPKGRIVELLDLVSD